MILPCNVPNPLQKHCFHIHWNCWCKIGYISQYGFATATDLSYGILGDAYGISQYKFDNPLFPGQPSDWYSSTVPAGLVIEGIRILVNPIEQTTDATSLLL